MKFFVLLASLVLAANAAEEYCYDECATACKSTPKGANILKHCNAKYGAIEKVLPELEDYVNTHIMRSFEYLLHSTHFSNYQKSRAGFEKLFRKLSDSTWEDAINLLKYIGKRGGTHRFLKPKDDPLAKENEALNYEMSELEALSKAVDVQKTLASDAFKIYERAAHHHDAETTHYIQEDFAEKQAEEIRSLVGHVSDLNKMLNTQDNSLSLYLFDEYLQKV